MGADVVVDSGKETLQEIGIVEEGDITITVNITLDSDEGD